MRNKVSQLQKMKIKEFLLKYGREFKMTVVAGKKGEQKSITSQRLHRPGLALAGFYERFTSERIQIIGETELAYINTLSGTQQEKVAEKFLSHEIPMIVVSKNKKLPQIFYDIAEKNSIVIVETELVTEDFMKYSSNVLAEIFAETATIHATLVSVYGVGMLYLGNSGIGKSECALDLIERGHRLVGDDVVIIKKMGKDILIGQGSDTLGHHMEIRGIGIINIEKMFGIESIRLQKRIEVAVRLEKWEHGKSYQRLGTEAEQDFYEVLGVKLPIITIPITPGKNITVISEVIAMNHMLKVYGYNTAERFNQMLLDTMEKKRRTQIYLSGDFE